MNKKEFIKVLNENAGFKEEYCITIVNILENNIFIGKNNKEKILNRLEDELNIKKEDANIIYNTSMEIIKDGLKDKIKHPFKSQD